MHPRQLRDIRGTVYDVSCSLALLEDSATPLLMAEGLRRKDLIEICLESSSGMSLWYALP